MTDYAVLKNTCGPQSEKIKKTCLRTMFRYLRTKV